MKYYTFFRESNDFKDILTDANLKKYIQTNIGWNNHLMISLSPKIDERVLGYLVLKYGDELTNPLKKDFAPIPNKDYIPNKK